MREATLGAILHKKRSSPSRWRPTRSRGARSRNSGSGQGARPGPGLPGGDGHGELTPHPLLARGCLGELLRRCLTRAGAALQARARAKCSHLLDRVTGLGGHGHHAGEAVACSDLPPPRAKPMHSSDLRPRPFVWAGREAWPTCGSPCSATRTTEQRHGPHSPSALQGCDHV